MLFFNDIQWYSPNIGGGLQSSTANCRELESSIDYSEFLEQLWQTQNSCDGLKIDSESMEDSLL